MASIDKIEKPHLAHLMMHNNRTKDDGHSHSNEKIDLERTDQNYHFKKGEYADINKIMDMYYHQDRKNMVSVIDVKVTLPKDVKEEDEQNFFKAVYDFYCNDFGEENIVNAVVHKDETTPHIHIDVVPVKVYRRENEIPYASKKFTIDELSDEMKKRIANWEQETEQEFRGIVCCKDLINRNYLRLMHPRLSEFVTERLGYECEILNGATENGNKTVLRLKNESLEKEIDEKSKELALLDKNVNIIVSKAKELDIDTKFFSSTLLLDKMERYKKERDLYKETLLRSGITNIEIPDDVKGYLVEPSSILSERFVYKNGIYIPEDNHINVIETFRNEERILPQRQFIESDIQLERIIEKMRPKEIKLVNYNKKFLIFPTDNIEDTFRNLIKIKKFENNIDMKLAFPEISNDKFHLAENILRNCQFETEYYLKAQRSKEDIQLELEL